MIDLKTEGGIARIFLNRHEKANALDARLLNALREAFESLARDSDLRVAVLGGHGGVFCGGADVNAMAKLDASSAAAFVPAAGAGRRPAARRGDWRRAGDRRVLRPAHRGRWHEILDAGSTPGHSLGGRGGRCCRACEWGLVEEVGGDEAVERVLASAFDPQKHRAFRARQALKLAL